MTDEQKIKELRERKISSWSLTIAVIFLILSIVAIVLLVLYILYWREKFPGVVCESYTECGANQTCDSGFCATVRCVDNRDCESGACLGGFCNSYSCLFGNDCPENMACVSGTCTTIHSECQSNDDCGKLSCSNGRCVQCTATTQCELGQGCFSNICRYPYPEDHKHNMLNFESEAQNNGNILAPPGYLCSSNICGTGTDQSFKIECENQDCPNSCPFCVSGVCRCVKGANRETCKENQDCVSDFCVDTGQGKVCADKGSECLDNFHGNTGPMVCPESSPYCVSGKCQINSLGAVCGMPHHPADICTRYLFGLTGDVGFFCVNGKCDIAAGDLNDHCVANGCSFIQSGELSCRTIETPTINMRRCLITK